MMHELSHPNPSRAEYSPGAYRYDGKADHKKRYDDNVAHL